MKILFYLPAVTPWWFETLVAPMLRRLYDEAELHVIVAPLWSDTGLELEHVEPLADLPAINWHIVVPNDPYQFRINGADVDGLLNLVHTIDPDITLARSADRHTPELFPGEVRYITEPGAEPFHAPHRWCVLDRHPFHHGVMPDELAATADHAAVHMAPVWKALEETYAEAHPGAARAQLGLPADRPILAVPLQYERVENFHGVGSPFQYGPEFVRELLDQLDERILLAVTDHPLNAKYLIRAGLDRLAAEYPDRIRLLPVHEEYGSSTNLLVRAVDGILLDQSKCIFLAAFFGTPIVHVGDSLMAHWMNATPLSALTAEQLVNRRLPAADRAMARRWFGWHFGTRLLNAREITLERLQDRILNRTSAADAAELIAFLEPWFNTATVTAQEMMKWAADAAGEGQIAA